MLPQPLYRASSKVDPVNPGSPVPALRASMSTLAVTPASPSRASSRSPRQSTMPSPRNAAMMMGGAETAPPDPVEQLLRDLLKLPENGECCDCRDPHPTYCNSTLGLFLCDQCAALHKQLLPKPLGEIKALFLGTHIDANVLTNLQVMGNRKNRQKYLQTASDQFEVPSPTADTRVKGDWIRAKYELRFFMNPRQGYVSLRQIKEHKDHKAVRYWGTLDGIVLRCAKERAGEAIERDIDLNVYSILKPPALNKAGKAYQFTLRASKGVYKIECDEKEEAEEWIEAIKAAHAKITYFNEPRLRAVQSSSRRSVLAASELKELLNQKIQTEQERAALRKEQELLLHQVERDLQQAVASEAAMAQALKSLREQVANLSEQRTNIKLRLSQLAPVDDKAPRRPISAYPGNSPLSAAPPDQLLLKDGVLMAGSVHALIEFVTSEHSDPDTQNVFLLTYRSFVTPEDLLDALIMRWAVAARPGRDEKETRRVIQLRTFNLFKHWLTNHYHDFNSNNDLARKLISWLESPAAMEPELAQIVETLKGIVKKQVSGLGHLTNMRTSMKLKTASGPAPLLSIDKDIVRITDIEPLELARQLTLLEFDIFQRIEPREFLNQAWTTRVRETAAPNVVAMIDRANETTRWLSTLILSDDQPLQRAKTIEYWIAVAQAAKEMNNLNLVMEVISGLHTNAVRRLAKTWILLSPKAAQSMEDLKNLISPLRQHGAYRAHLKTVMPPCLPSLPVYLTDLVFLEEAHPDWIGGLVNFAKRRRIAEILRDVSLYQDSPFPFRQVSDLLPLITHIPRLLSEDAADRRSQELEPGQDPSVPRRQMSPQDVEEAIWDLASK